MEAIITRSLSFVFLLPVLLLFTGSVCAQADDICAESGLNPGLDSPFAHVPYVFGKVSVRSAPTNGKPPKVTVIFLDGQQTPERTVLNSSGNYCFRRKTNSGTIVVEVNGIEAARRTLTSSGETQQREDFDFAGEKGSPLSPPSTVSAKFARPQNEKTIGLYKVVADAQKAKDLDKAIGSLKEIVAIDPADFIAWAQLGSIYFEKTSLPEAEAAFRKTLELRIDYTPAWINVGKMRVFQKQYAAAIEIFKQAISTDQNSARAYQLLGEAYLLNKQGTLGVEALKQAIKLDPIGMAECHLQMAHLYELAGAKQLAAGEYKQFLAKVPDHPDRKKFEKFIKENQ